MVRSSSSRLSFWKILSIGPSALLFDACPPVEVELSNGNLVLAFLKNGRGSSFLGIFYFEASATCSIPTLASFCNSFLFCEVIALQDPIPQLGKANKCDFTR